METDAKAIAFDSPDGERLYGLGQFQDGALDVRNLPRRLVQVNTQVASPFLVSTRGWGLYWHTYAKVDFNPCTNFVAPTLEWLQAIPLQRQVPHWQARPPSHHTVVSCPVMEHEPEARNCWAPEGT